MSTVKAFRDQAKLQGRLARVYQIIGDNSSRSNVKRDAAYQVSLASANAQLYLAYMQLALETELLSKAIPKYPEKVVKEHGKD